MGRRCTPMGRRAKRYIGPLDKDHAYFVMIIISGASGGLGQHLVRDLHAEFDIIGTYKSHVQSPTDGVEYAQVDVTDSLSISHFVDSVSDRLNHITLINLAGVSINGIGHKLREEDWNEVIATNITGSFLFCKALLPRMRAQQWGRVIFVSSIVADLGVAGTVAYAASKAAVRGLVRALAVENALKGITVNALSLGYFDAGMGETIIPDQRERIKQTIPMRCFGNPRNVASAVRFLIESDYTTGSTIHINGGLL